MITVTRCARAAGVVLIVTSLSAAGESPEVAIPSAAPFTMVVWRTVVGASIWMAVP